MLIAGVQGYYIPYPKHCTKPNLKQCVAFVDNMVGLCRKAGQGSGDEGYLLWLQGEHRPTSVLKSM